MKRREGGYEIGLVNPLTLVGKEIREILRERGLPVAGIALIDTTGEQQGTLTEDGEEAALIVPATEDAFAPLDIVFFCGNRDANEQWIERRVEDGFLAIDLSRPAPHDGEGVTVVADVNSHDLSEETTLIVSPHPVAVPIAILVDRLSRELSLRLCAATVVQPASAFGKAGIDELFAQTIAVLNLENPPKEIFGRQLAFNLYPASNAHSIESEISAQLRTALGRSIPVSVSLTQGTLFHGHMFSIFVEFDDDVDAEAIAKALEQGGAVTIADEDEHPSTVDAGGLDEIVVSRIACDPAVPGGVWIWAASDNLRRGAALNAVLALEFMIVNFGEPVN